MIWNQDYRATTFLLQLEFRSIAISVGQAARFPRSYAHGAPGKRGSADGTARRDRPAVGDVLHRFAIQVLGDNASLRRERLVRFDRVHVAQKPVIGAYPPAIHVSVNVLSCSAAILAPVRQTRAGLLGHDNRFFWRS